MQWLYVLKSDRQIIIRNYGLLVGEFGDAGSDNGVSSGAVAGIVIGVILLIVIIIIAYMFLRRHLRRMKFERFQDRSVSFSKNGSINGHATNYELDPAATKFKPESGNYS